MASLENLLASQTTSAARLAKPWHATLRRSGLITLAIIACLGMIFNVHHSPKAYAQEIATITVDANTTYQTIDGFGASLVDQVVPGPSDASLALAQMGTTQQQQILDLLFSKTSGAGLSIDRFELGAGQFYEGLNDFTIEPNSPGSPSASPNYVWDHSADQQVWIAQQAKTRGVTQFYGDAWSAPAFMKDNNSVANSGSLCGEVTCSSGDWRQAYANYLAQYLADYQSEGITVTHVDPVNEPEFNASYQSMAFSGAQLADFIKILRPTLDAAQLHAAIVCCDEGGYDNTNTRVNAVLADSTAASDLGVASVHGYGTSGTISAFTNATSAGKHTWQSEYCCNSGTWNTQYSSGDCDGASWSDKMAYSLQNGVSAYFAWTGAWSHSDNEDLIRLVDTSTYQVSSRLWVMGNYSRFVRPGAVRIGASTSDSNMVVTAFKNTDGTYAIVVDNHNSAAQSVNISIPALASATVTPYVTNDDAGLAKQSSLSLPDGTLSTTMPPNATVTYQITDVTNANGSGIVDNGTYEILNNGSNLALSIRGNGINDGGYANQWGWNGYASQYWKLVPQGNGLYEILSTNQNDNEALSVEGNTTTQGAYANQWTWNGYTSQYWKFLSQGNGTYEIVNNLSGDALSIEGNSTAQDGSVNQWPWISASSQYWQLIQQ